MCKLLQAGGGRGGAGVRRFPNTKADYLHAHANTELTEAAIRAAGLHAGSINHRCEAPNQRCNCRSAFPADQRHRVLTDGRSNVFYVTARADVFGKVCVCFLLYYSGL